MFKTEGSKTKSTEELRKRKEQKQEKEDDKRGETKNERKSEGGKERGKEGKRDEEPGEERGGESEEAGEEDGEREDDAGTSFPLAKKYDWSRLPVEARLKIGASVSERKNRGGKNWVAGVALGVSGAETSGEPRQQIEGRDRGSVSQH